MDCLLNSGNPEILPQFVCEEYGGDMYLQYYKGVHRYEYRTLGAVREARGGRLAVK
jgi:hypothetical protein